MLDFERPFRRDVQLQDAVTAEPGGPGCGCQFGTDDRGPVRLEPSEPAAVARNDRRGEPGHRVAERAKAGAALAANAGTG